MPSSRLTMIVTRGAVRPSRTLGAMPTYIHIAWGVVVTCLLCCGRPSMADDYAIHDGDTVVFLGDSITAARTYSKIIEDYTLLRFPNRKVRFVNAGVGGDTAEGGLKRLDRDVFARGATLLTVAYGINDIGWGLRADAEHKAWYLQAVRGIVEACRARKVKVYICSAPVTAEDPDKSEEGFLQKMCDEAMALSRTMGGGSIDVQRTMRGIQKKVWAANQAVKEKTQKTALHAADGVHLNDLGHLAMAFAILKGLGAPSEVSSACVDAQDPQRFQARGCTLSGIKVSEGRVEFTRLDTGLPFNHGLFYVLNFRFVPVPDELSQYLLTVRNLPEGRYLVLADGRGVGTFAAQQLARGINIASSTVDGWAPGGPWNAQANILQSLTDARHNVAAARLMTALYLPGSATPTSFDVEAEKANSQLEATQRIIARPKPYHFVIKGAESKND